MKVPDKRFNSTGAKGLEPKERARRRLSGDIAGTRVPSLDFNPNSDRTSDDAAFEYLKAFCRNIIRSELQQYVYSSHENGESV